MTLSVDAAMAAFNPELPLAVGLSGGADSTALLVAAAQKWPGQVRAIHVNHGLQAAAAVFEAHCVQLCRALQVPLVVQRVDARHASGQSPEDAARQARYQAFDAALAENSALGDVKSIALAQHADDQVETMLLALSRGAGVAGLAAMPAQWQRAGRPWYRPWLQVPGSAVRDWLRQSGQTWVEDPSNSDERFTRNRIRARLLPALEAAFPAFRDTFGRAASHAAQADALLQEVAQQDLLLIGAPPQIKALQALSRARQANVLRHWLRVHHHTTPSAAQLAELLDQVAACTTRGHRLRLRVGRGFVVRQGPILDWCCT
ncbi:tRNA(Ile)-lysidine synthase [Acidovorax sp. 56]|uniref:tRNA lysidine(34) synthetase TilS n=1 Tax=Acidovorax sp. 56 TaxID=2035205 RepID=UPI000C173A22|nr:tRNA lysidine(34) synthetase TilS [Acidovorax sp. 56]PIF25668.1 tRNA(Ile)-lysidine synthase [Acidovorax sp. 56]